MKFDLNNYSNNGYPMRLSSFNTYMESVKGSTSNTTESYSRDIMIFLRYMKLSRGLTGDAKTFDQINVKDIDDKFLNSITLADFYDFLVFCRQQLENGSSTIARKIAALRSFFKYLHKKINVIDNDFTEELDKPKIGKRKIKYMDLSDAQQLLGNLGGRNQSRDYAILTLFLNCGLRLSELCSINIDDVNNETIRIIGKGNKERFVYLNEECMYAIESYLPEREKILTASILRKKQNSKSDNSISGGTITDSNSKKREINNLNKIDNLDKNRYEEDFNFKNNSSDKKQELETSQNNALFISERGNRVARRTVQEIVERQLKNAGVYREGLSTHKLRHTAATLLYKYGNVDILVLKEILGHENVSTTQIYTHTDSDMIRNAVKENPLNTMKKRNT